MSASCSLDLSPCKGLLLVQLRTWWLAIKTRRWGNLNSTLPSAVSAIWSATDASPLMKISLGPHHLVMFVVIRANDFLETAM
jgi:hypothetical protein